MALDLKAMMATPDGGDPDQGDDNASLMDALDQMRALCDKIEAEQMRGSMAPKAAAPPGDKSEVQ